MSCPEAVYLVRFFDISEKSSGAPVFTEIDVDGHRKGKRNFDPTKEAPIYELALTKAEIEQRWRRLAESEQYGQVVVISEGLILACEKIRGVDDKLGDTPSPPLELVWVYESAIDSILAATARQYAMTEATSTAHLRSEAT